MNTENRGMAYALKVRLIDRVIHTVDTHVSRALSYAMEGRALRFSRLGAGVQFDQLCNMYPQKEQPK